MFLMGTADTTGGNIQHPTTFQMIHMDRWVLGWKWLYTSRLMKQFIKWNQRIHQHFYI
jgi:hypothetical protein